MFRALKICSLQAVVSMGIVTLSSVNCFAQSYSTPCNPLLILIEGANQYIGSAETDGSSMVDLAGDIFDEFNKKNISVIVMDNDPYWSDLELTIFEVLLRMPYPLTILQRILGSNTILWEKMEETSRAIYNSGFNPVVIVGHSFGGATGYYLADNFPVKLLVTLDAISRPYEHHKRKPYLAQEWWNIWVDDNFGKVGEVAFFPKSWRKHLPADVNYHIRGDVSHSDVMTMWLSRHKKYGSAKNAVLRALSDISLDCFKEFNPSELCNIDSVGCSYSVEFKSECKGPDLEIELLEIDITSLVLSISNVTVPKDGRKVTASLMCDNPANRVCFNHDQQAVFPKDSDKWCGHNCCTLCSVGQKVDDRVEKVEFVCPGNTPTLGPIIDRACPTCPIF